MLQRLCSILFSFFLLSACGKYVVLDPIIEDNNSSLDGFWLATKAAHHNDVLPSLMFLNHGRLAFVYPVQEGDKSQQAQEAHTIIPLTWQSHKQEISITTLHTDKKQNTENVEDSESTNHSTQLFSYTLDMEQNRSARLTLTPTDPNSPHGAKDPDDFSMTYTQDNDAIGIIQGSLFFRERMMLPPDATAVILLQDTSRADAPATVLSSIALSEAYHTPLAFQIPYIKADIHPSHSYSLRAYIVSQGTMFFSTTNAYPVLRKAQENRPISVDLLLHRVHSDDTTQEDANATNLQNTYWLLQSLRGNAVQHFEGQTEAHLILSPDGKSAGSDGCNRFFGTFTTHKQRITLFPAGSTMMMCPHGDKQAAIFMSSLQEATAYSITGQTLELLRGKDVIARFKAQNLP